MYYLYFMRFLSLTFHVFVFVVAVDLLGMVETIVVDYVSHGELLISMTYAQGLSIW
jgi:hypothetical protein